MLICTRVSCICNIRIRLLCRFDTWSLCSCNIWIRLLCISNIWTLTICNIRVRLLCRYPSNRCGCIRRIPICKWRPMLIDNRLSCIPLVLIKELLLCIPYIWFLSSCNIRIWLLCICNIRKRLLCRYISNRISSLTLISKRRPMLISKRRLSCMVSNSYLLETDVGIGMVVVL